MMIVVVTLEVLMEFGGYPAVSKNRQSAWGFPLYLGRRQSPNRIFRPRMFRIPTAQFFPDIVVGTLPKAGKILGHLHRAFSRRQEMQHDGNLPVRNAGGIFATEHLL